MHELERRIPPRVLGDEVEEVPLRHERDELAVRRQVLKSATGTSSPPTTPLTIAGLLVRPLQELVEQTELVQDLERRRMDRVAAEIPEEVAVLLEHDNVDSRPSEQEAEHHPRGAAARDAAGGFQGIVAPGVVV